jgi:hypothetical protein
VSQDNRKFRVPSYSAGEECERSATESGIDISTDGILWFHEFRQLMFPDLGAAKLLFERIF